MIALSILMPTPEKLVHTQMRIRSHLSLSSLNWTPAHYPNIPSTYSIGILKFRTHLSNPVMEPNQTPKPYIAQQKMLPFRAKKGNPRSVPNKKVMLLCGFGYWMQGFRCLPWLALNFHMVNALNLDPSTLQVVQNSGNLPMVAKPLYGLLSDSVYFGESHRLPYISAGVFLQALSWCAMGLSSNTDTFPSLMVWILLSNLGASVSEVANDALIAEIGKKCQTSEFQSFAFLSMVAGGLLGNLSGGFLLQKIQPRFMFLVFFVLLFFQLVASLATKEALLLSYISVDHHMPHSIFRNISKQFSDLVAAVNNREVSYPLFWVVASVAIVPMLSGSVFCYLTQSLNVSPSVIGMSKVIGQLIVLLMTFFSKRYLRRMPLRKLICGVQIIYALSLLSDWLLVKQLNVKLGFSNESHVLVLSSLAEAISQFKLLPFSILFANLSPSGCEGSLTAFVASALCLSSIVSGFLGVGLASLVGVTTDDYSALSMGILFQFFAALLPLMSISYLPLSQMEGEVKSVHNRKHLFLINSNECKEGCDKLHHS